MALKHTQFISYGDDNPCEETKQFIEQSGVILNIRDIEKNPLSVTELERLIGYLNISHFLNRSSQAYKKHGLDKKLPGRNEIIELMVNDHTLIRRPIIKSARLITVGCDKQKISEMLQINSNGDASDDEENNSYNVIASERKSSKNSSRSSNRSSARTGARK